MLPARKRHIHRAAGSLLHLHLSGHRVEILARYASLQVDESLD
jgi:hypothetical protein